MNDAYQLNQLKYFYTHTPALSIEKLTIRRQKITALIGPNGCGKSTLLNLLAFIHHPQQGQIDFFSNRVQESNAHAFIKRVALVPQKPFMLRGTVVENLMLPLKFHMVDRKNRKLKVQTILDQLNINHLQTQQAKNLSGGELQKVALARALIYDPEVLLMDEPFSYLDHTSELFLEEFIQHYVNDNHKTLVFSTHNRLQGVAIANDVISLVKGEPVENPLINVFDGICKDFQFDTGKIQLLLAENNFDSYHVSIAPGEIVLSREPLVSSMRNQFLGKITAITDQSGKIRVTVLADEVFQVLITYSALKALNISVGESIWVNFKSNSILLF